jgi:hypothetical protein
LKKVLELEERRVLPFAVLDSDLIENELGVPDGEVGGGQVQVGARREQVVRRVLVHAALGVRRERVRVDNSYLIFL